MISLSIALLFHDYRHTRAPVNSLYKLAKESRIAQRNTFEPVINSGDNLTGAHRNIRLVNDVGVLA